MPDGLIAVYRSSMGVGIPLQGSPPRPFDGASPEVRSIGQAAMQGNDVLLADPQSGTIWRRPLAGKYARVSACAHGRTGRDRAGRSAQRGLRGHGHQGGPARAARQRGSLGNRRALSERSPPGRHGRGGLPATPPRASSTSSTPRRAGDPHGSACRASRAPAWTTWTIPTRSPPMPTPSTWPTTATGVWWWPPPRSRPDIVRLPRGEGSPVVAVKIPLSVSQPGRLSLNVYDQNDVTVRQVAWPSPRIDRSPGTGAIFTVSGFPRAATAITPCWPRSSRSAT